MTTLTEMEQMLEQLEVLRAARASGVRRVQYGERMTEYRSDAELAAAIDDLLRRINAVAPTTPRILYLNSSKGVH